MLPRPLQNESTNESEPDEANETIGGRSRLLKGPAITSGGLAYSTAAPADKVAYKKTMGSADTPKTRPWAGFALPPSLLRLRRTGHATADRPEFAVLRALRGGRGHLSMVWRAADHPYRRRARRGQSAG